MRKLERAGFTGITVQDERVFSIDDLARYPLFPTSLIENMRRLLPPERRQAVARSVVFTARKEGEAAE